MSDKKNFLKKRLHKDSVVNQVVEQITDSIIAGNLQPGDKLPTEPELCENFGIGRNSVREAIKILEAYGVIYIKRAEGTFVNDTYNHKMLDPMLYGILLDKNMRIDIIQVRKVLDTGMLYQIIGGVTDEKMNQILKKFDNLKTVVLSENVTAKQVLQADVEYHQNMNFALELILLESTENPMLCNIHEYVDRITTPSREKTVELVLEKNQKETFILLHQKIINLLLEKNYQKIESVLAEHYQFWVEG